MSKIITIIIIIVAGIAAFFILSGKKASSALSDLTNKGFSGLNMLPTDSAEIAYSPKVLSNVEAFHNPTSDFVKISRSVNQWGESGGGTYTDMAGNAISQASAISKGIIDRPTSGSSGPSSNTGNLSGSSSTLHSRMGVA